MPGYKPKPGTYDNSMTDDFGLAPHRVRTLRAQPKIQLYRAKTSLEERLEDHRAKNGSPNWEPSAPRRESNQSDLEVR
jgi:hypothetical protein